MEEHVEAWLADHSVGALEIFGGPAFGKSTALAHLAATLNPEREVLFLDDAQLADVAVAKTKCPVVFAAERRMSEVADVVLRLVPWGDDELIEYLLAAHRDQCRSVMARVGSLEGRSLLHGNPALWRIVLDRMAADESAINVRTILRSALSELFSNDSVRSLAQAWGYAWVFNPAALLNAGLCELDFSGVDDRLMRLLRHRVMQTLLAIDELKRLLESRKPTSLEKLPRDLASEVGVALRDSPRAVARLRAIATKGEAEAQPIAASILHATGTGWRPTGRRLPRLSGGLFVGADWSGLNLACVDLSRADLTRANLRGTNLIGADMRECRLPSARLAGAKLDGCRADLANFVAADLSGACATGAFFGRAQFAHANLSGAVLDRADLQHVDLTSANLRNATLRGVDLRGALIAGTDLSCANLESTNLARLPLRIASSDGAAFIRACLVECDLEGVRLENPDFRRADLSRALLTSSSMPRARFNRACLRGAGLADVDWPHADLRAADLRGSTFFLGSSRSGLVGSPIACEGSRTGFYTDEYDETAFKAPEEIRKANLRGADLRGALIEDVDFYLVDLREAVYSRSQAEHFRRCGAILFDRLAE